MHVTEFAQQLINGLSLGAFYALIALGYTMVYGILRFINFAHGDVFMLGAFSGYYLTPKLMPHFTGALAPVGVVVVLLATMCICALIGIVIERLAYRPLRRQPKLTVLITAIGVSLFLEYGGQFIFGADPKAFPELVADRALTHGRADDHHYSSRCFCDYDPLVDRAYFHRQTNQARNCHARRFK